VDRNGSPGGIIAGYREGKKGGELSRTEADLALRSRGFHVTHWRRVGDLTLRSAYGFDVTKNGFDVTLCGFDVTLYGFDVTLRSFSYLFNAFIVKHLRGLIKVQLYHYRII
jgi:hypothetical protein